MSSRSIDSYMYSTHISLVSGTIKRICEMFFDCASIHKAGVCSYSRCRSGKCRAHVPSLGNERPNLASACATNETGRRALGLRRLMLLMLTGAAVDE